MNRWLYNAFLHSVAAPILALYYGPKILFYGKYRQSLLGKFGALPVDFEPENLTSPKIWFHAVSVGEVNALLPLVQETVNTLPNAAILVSTGTETGQDAAKKIITNAAQTFFLPLDFPEFVGKVVQRIEPDVFVLMETELWPNLIHYLKKQGTDIILANGRISDRSYPRYRLMKRFFASTLDRIDLFLMASELDAQRIEDIGGQKHRIRVTGNTKFDAVQCDMNHSTRERIARLIHFKSRSRAIIAGSTHPGEDEIILDAYSRLLHEFPDLLLVLVPRHVERSNEIISLITQRNMPAPFLRSMADHGFSREGNQIVIWDKTGELQDVYSIASVVFVGGSLVPRGGQNIIEPAIWEKIVIFGPSMEDFRDARDILLRCGAAIEVKDRKGLAAAIRSVLVNPEESLLAAKKGREALLSNKGSAKRNASFIAECVRARERR